ncbi:MAG: hypothetical protein LBH60_02905, partial [Prevotellaceae bacterium]|nr:hypothetical protein [Prevotellaceae bacterium]
EKEIAEIYFACLFEHILRTFAHEIQRNCSLSLSLSQIVVFSRKNHATAFCTATRRESFPNCTEIPCI